MIIKEEAPFPINNPYKSNNMEQIDRIQSKIKCEIETAEKFIKKMEVEYSMQDYIGKSYHYGKIKSLQDLQQWIKNNIGEG